MIKRFDLRGTPLSGLMEIQRHPIQDERGHFERFFCADELRAAGMHEAIAQINRTLTRLRGTVRGLHYQIAPHGETKLVSCIRGEVFDVAVDLRRQSSTFLAWYGTILSEVNRMTLLVPDGFAHGFQTLCDDCELLYLHSARYASQAESGVHPEDPRIGIRWPLEITGMSQRDATREMLPYDFPGVPT
jgi:dTDP-4-dehydrorhamnose 3,5-epimerase